jgi:hypothetical protein
MVRVAMSLEVAVVAARMVLAAELGPGQMWPI